MTDMKHEMIKFVFEQVDQVGAQLVASTYRNIVQHYSAVIFTLTTIYVGFVFIKMIRGHYDVNDFLMLILRTVILLTLALNYEYFCLFIYDVFTNVPLSLCRSITIHGNSAESVSITNALDNYLNSGWEVVTQLFKSGGWSNPTYMIFGVLVFILILLSTAVAAGLIVMAKCASTIILALSPIFIICAIFDTTKGLFDSYIRQLITYALVPIMTSAVLMIVLTVSQLAIHHITDGDSYSFLSLLPFCMMCVIQFFLLLQVKAKCSALASGFHLPSVISALRQSKSEFASVGNRVSNAAGSVSRNVSAMMGFRPSQQATQQRNSRFKS